MRSPHDAGAEVRRVTPDTDSHGPRQQPSPESAPSREAQLRAKLLWSVPETAFMTGVSARTVWRELSNPKSKFPRPRRLRGRTLLVAAEVVAFLLEAAS